MATFSRARELCARLGNPPQYLLLLFLFLTAAAIRGELVRANEMVVDLIALAEEHNDRAVVLNARRGHAGILLFLGALAESVEEGRRAIELFETSNEVEQLGARGAGEDAGAAVRAVLSWGLWLRGEVDEAVAQLAAALERANAVKHPHIQAYVLCYGAILHALRGETSIAQSYAERCFPLSDTLDFRRGRGLSQTIRDSCVVVVDSALGDVTSALNEYRRLGY